MRREFAQEAKAMEMVIKSLYHEKEYLEGIKSGENDRIAWTSERAAQLKIVNHFISLYEGY